MQEIQLRTAKATLSAVIDSAQRGEPSIITLLMAAPLEPGDSPERDSSAPRETEF